MRTKRRNIVFDLKILNVKCCELFNAFDNIVYLRCIHKLTILSFEGTVLYCTFIRYFDNLDFILKV